MKQKEYECPYFVPISRETEERERKAGLHLVSINYCESMGTGVKCKYESNDKIVGCRRLKECPAYQKAKKEYIEELQKKGEENFS